MSSTNGADGKPQVSAAPVLASFVGYRGAWIRSDVSAGLAIAAVGIPSAIAYPASLIQGSLLFFNADHVKARLIAIADGLPAGTRWFVLDASAIVQVDSTASAMLEEFRADLAARGVALGLAELHADVRRLLERADLIDAIGAPMVFEDLDDALRAFERLNPQLNGGKQ